MTKGVITLAINEAYLEMACHLAASFCCFHSTGNVGFTIITNKPFTPWKSLASRGVKVLISEDLVHEGQNILMNKLVAAMNSPYDRTIMLDADCLLGGSLDPVFEMLAGKDFAVVGERITTGFWHAEVERMRAHFLIPYVYRFVGSFYYFCKSATVARVFEAVIPIAAECDQLGVAFVHGRLRNEEVPLSIAMAAHGGADQILAIPESLPVKAETMFYPRRSINILWGQTRMSTGVASLRSEFFENEWPLEKSSVIIAYDTDSRRRIDYRLNVMQMRTFLAFDDGQSSGQVAKRLCDLGRLSAILFLCSLTFLINRALNAKQRIGSLYRRCVASKQV
jgi:hypothetical protein